jgi:hypothetical protein
MPRKKQPLRLIDTPRDTEVRLADGGTIHHNANGHEVSHDTFMFGHIDGMYSFCTLVDDPDVVFHLRFDTEVEIVTHSGLEFISTEV